MSFLLDKKVNLSILTPETKKDVNKKGNRKVFKQILDPLAMFTYGLLLRTWGTFLPEVYVYYIGLAVIILTCIAEGFVLWYFLRRFFIGSFTVLWVRSCITSVVSKMNVKNFP